MKTFISHAHQDKWFANRLVKLLNELGVNSWYDTVELCIGDNLLQKIHEGLAECSHFIVILSKHAIRSKWVEEELYTFYQEYVQGKKVKVYPFLLDDVWRQTPTFLKKYVYANFRNSTRKQLNAAGIKAVEKEFRGVALHEGHLIKCYNTQNECRLIVTLPEGKSKAEINQMAQLELKKLRPKLSGQKLLMTGRMTYTLAMMVGAYLGNICREISAYDPQIPDELVPIFLPAVKRQTISRKK